MCCLNLGVTSHPSRTTWISALSCFLFSYSYPSLRRMIFSRTLGWTSITGREKLIQSEKLREGRKNCFASLAVSHLFYLFFSTFCMFIVECNIFRASSIFDPKLFVLLLLNLSVVQCYHSNSFFTCYLVLWPEKKKRKRKNERRFHSLWKFFLNLLSFEVLLLLSRTMIPNTQPSLPPTKLLCFHLLYIFVDLYSILFFSMYLAMRGKTAVLYLSPSSICAYDTQQNLSVHGLISWREWSALLRDNTNGWRSSSRIFIYRMSTG